jgi:predicted N-acyltransferase
MQDEHVDADLDHDTRLPGHGPVTLAMRPDAYRTRVHADPREIDAAAWDGLAGTDPDANPFVRHAYLSALHASGAASAATGWLARYLTVWRGDALVAAVPLYAKGHSYGEYVFDWAWAEAHERMGEPYYPKWLVAIPFTPVTGSRLLARDAPARQAGLAALLDATREHDLSSLHVLFAPPAQVEALAGQGLIVRPGIQFHWRNLGYRDFEDYLGALLQPKRKKIRAERRMVREAGVRVDRRSGTDISAQDWSFFQSCYENTYRAHGATPYLNLDFFRTIARDMPANLMMVRAHRDGLPVASALAVYDRGCSAVYGRYWGCVEPVPCLHFECCYYQMIEFAIEQQLQVFEGGAQGAHKLARGLDPVPTHSAHWLRVPAMHAAVARAVARESAAVTETFDELGEHRALRAAAASANRPI